MLSNQFEKAFGDFLDSSGYDAAQDALFTVVRKAFFAGWEAANGEAAEEVDAPNDEEEP